MNLMLNFFYAFLACFAIGYSFYTPRRGLIFAGLVGGFGQLFFDWSYMNFHSETFAVFLGTVVVYLISELSAKTRKMPVTVFLTTGILPLVPGVSLYQAMLSMVENRMNDGINYLLKATYHALAIAAGIAILAALFRVIRGDNDEQRKTA